MATLPCSTEQLHEDYFALDSVTGQIVPKAAPVSLIYDPISTNTTILNTSGNMEFDSTQNIGKVTSTGKIQVPGVLQHAITFTENNTLTTFNANGSFNNITVNTAPISIANTTGEKRLFTVHMSVRMAYQVPATTTQDTWMRLSINTTTPLTTSGLTSVFLGDINQIRTSPATANGDSWQGNYSFSFMLNDGATNTLNIIGTWLGTTASGTATFTALIDVFHFEVTSYPAE